jgi:outer membrane receptor for ferrienterochelin and colicins
MKAIRVFPALFLGVWQLFHSPQMHAQQVRGLVLEQDDKGKLSPLQGVNVYWLGTQEGTSTDSLGFFEIPTLAGSKQLVFSYIGYKADTLYAKPTKELQVVLKQVRELDEVTVLYRSKATEISSLDVQKIQVMSEKELFKAACCNLSESFETNPSIDVSLTDAVTGTRQIQMLGLGSPYMLFSQENMPTIRGLAANQGFGFIPGTWIESIQVSKGTGSVVNGFESMTGQLNLEYQKPEQGDRLYFNGYFNESGRMEGNLVSSYKLGKKTGNTTFLHYSQRPWEVDNNGDRFVDLPRGTQLNLMNRMMFADPAKGVEAQLGFRLIEDVKVAGNLGYDPRRTVSTIYGMQFLIQRVEVWSKIGYVFPSHRYRSIGFQSSFLTHAQSGSFGRTDTRSSQHGIYANLIYQTIIGNTDHVLKTGLSYQGDRMFEILAPFEFFREEHVPGAFTEYQWTISPKASIVAGMRADYHSLFGWFATPRLHARWEIAPKTVLRFSSGQGRRSANLIAENEGLLFSSRQWRIQPTQQGGIYGFQQELSTNVGLSITRNFRLDYRDGFYSIEYFHTRFQRQVVVDIDANSREVNYYALQGESFAHAFQAEAEYELFKRFDLRLAYRQYLVQTDFQQGRLEKALVARHRAFANLAYETRGKLWNIDFTVQYIGSKRLPQTRDKPVEFQREARSPGYFIANAQVTRLITKSWHAYLGIENITGFVQRNPIISVDSPYGPHFDATMVWAPIFGRMFYVGFRYRLKKEKEKR